MTFELIAVSQDGTMLHGKLAKIRYQVSGLLPLLREQDILDPGQEKCAIIDPSGNLSTMKKPEKMRGDICRSPRTISARSPGPGLMCRLM